MKDILDFIEDELKATRKLLQGFYDKETYHYLKGILEAYERIVQFVNNKKNINYENAWLKLKYQLIEIESSGHMLQQSISNALLSIMNEIEEGGIT